MNKSDQLNELAGALAKAQGEIENASKSSKNPHFKSSYADLAEVLNTVRPVFSQHGLSVSQLPSYQDGFVHVETILMHSSGQWISGSVSAPVIGTQNAQGIGSAITYCRRYSLAAIAGIAQEDDDANSAAGHEPRPAPQRPAAKISAEKTKISAEQAERIRNGLAVAGMNEDEWCRTGGIASVEELAADRFSKAMAFIQQAAQVA